LPAYIINFHLYKLGYRPADLTPVVQMADLPLFLFVAEDIPVKTVAELVDYARKNPDKLTYASSGNGSITMRVDRHRHPHRDGQAGR
ncbi:tripartite tricarboxylate transporter substrate-binding protein, partial [Pseudomonas aeruginosa]|uniref:tripartite tricarboxylate transporter substrate-binding protein n=1 Tax=Pseudomonas aeruginosa TaxID=287 RepID=UPI0023E33A3B